METMKNILFYTDLSDESDGAFSFALQQAKSNDALLHVVHVLHSRYRFHGELVDGFITQGMMMGLNPEIIHATLKSIRSRYEPMLQGHGRVNFHVLNGVASIEILRFARRHGADLIVLSKDTAERKVKTSEDPLLHVILEKAACPVMLLANARGARGKKKANTLRTKAPSLKPRKVIPITAYLEKRKATHSCHAPSCRG